ncbi:MAG: GTPase Era [Lachnospiraceae bacterium]|nr:GTPase Era [Lachnospiraceae bacterium]
MEEKTQPRRGGYGPPAPAIGDTAQPYKSGFAALIGRPNVGKSTLVNGLLGQKIAATSSKPYTTRGDIRAILTRADGQIVFIDTPGIEIPGGRHGSRLAAPPPPEADVVLFVVDVRGFIGRSERHILSLLDDIIAPVILVVNKIDTVDWERVFAVIGAYGREREFSEIVPISAYEGKNLDELINVVMAHLPEGPPLFDEDMLTDQNEREIIAEMIREKALHALDQEVPYGLAVTVADMKWRRHVVDIEATIFTTRENHKAIIIGKQGAMIKKISTNARYEIERLLGKKVNLKIWVTTV